MKIKNIVFFAMFFFIGVICFSQELTVTSIVPDGGVGLSNGSWPSDVSPVRARWDNLFTKYNMAPLENDPFNPNKLVQRIGDKAQNAVWARGDSMTQYLGSQAYTVYITMGNRKFICLLYNELSNTRGFWYWVYEIK